MLASHSFATPSTPTQSLAKRLAAIPLEAWESETPVLDAIIRETTRVAQPHTAMRRNIGPDTYIDGRIIPSGAYIVYPFSDIHLDPKLYPNPWKFDPGRPVPKETPFGYVGWGGGLWFHRHLGLFSPNGLIFAGKTMCLGTRLAKVELKLIAAMFTLGFRHSVVDKVGMQADPLPIPNWNDILLCRPEETFYLKYERSDILL